MPVGSRGTLEIVDIRGKLIKSYALTEGHNQLEVPLNEYYSASVYFYTLNIDGGRIIRHKKMMLNK